MSSPIVTPTDSQDFLSMERSELDQPFDVGPVASENSYFTAPNSNSPAQSRLTRSNQETTDTTTKLNSGLNPWKVVANENTTVRMYGSTPDEPSDSQLAFEEQLKHDPKVVLQNNATSTANLFGTSSNSEMSKSENYLRADGGYGLKGQDSSNFVFENGSNYNQAKRADPNGMSQKSAASNRPYTSRSRVSSGTGTHTYVNPAFTRPLNANLARSSYHTRSPNQARGSIPQPWNQAQQNWNQPPQPVYTHDPYYQPNHDPYQYASPRFASSDKVGRTFINELSSMQKRIEQRDHEYDQLEDMFQKQLLNPDVNNSMKLLQQLKMERGYIKEGFNKACDIAEAALQRVADLSNQVKYMKEGKSERLAAKQDSNETNEVGNFMKELKLVRGKEIQFNGKSSENLLAQFVKLIREGTAELPSGTKLVYKRTPKSNDNNEATVDTYLFK